MDFESLDWDFLSENRSPFLFKTQNGCPIKFYLCVDNSTVKKSLKILIQISGGLPVGRRNLTPFTVVLADSLNRKNIIGRVAFKISYIIDCVESRSLKDINDYTWSKQNVKNKDYMNVIYFQTSTFNDEQSESESEDISRMEITCNNPCEHCALGKECGPNNNLNFQNNGNKHCFTCHCSPKQNSASPLSPGSQSVESRKNQSISTSFSESPPPTPHPPTPHPPPPHPPWRLQKENNIRERQSCSRYVTSDEDDIGPPDVKETLRANNPDNKHGKQPYTRYEKEAILKYIVNKNLYHSVGGVTIWKDMERRNICPNRTWMSMQNHFKRNLLKELYKYPFLTTEQIKKLQR